MFTEWVKNYHYSHGHFIYDSYHSYNSPWNSVLQRLNGRALTDSQLIEEVMEANLEHIQITLKEDIVKKYSKYIRDHALLTMKARIDFLNNLKLDDNTYAQSI
jgi:hypothetical protein